MTWFLKTVVSQNCGFISQKDTKPWFRKKEVMSGVSKTQKDYSFNKTMVLETTRFVASKHIVAFKNQRILQNHSISSIHKKYFASKQGLNSDIANITLTHYCFCILQFVVLQDATDSSVIRGLWCQLSQMLARSSKICVSLLLSF
jgi:hypothetical protein